MFQNLVETVYIGSRSSANLLLFVTILDSRPILLFIDEGLAKTKKTRVDTRETIIAQLWSVWRKLIGLGWQASRLDAVSNMDLAGSDNSSCGRTYSSCCQ